MNIRILAVSALSLSLVSCAVFDPEYAEYKKEKAQKAASNPAAGGDPYSNIASNPYGVPGNGPQRGGEVGRYNPNPGTPPYQPLPGVNSVPGQNYPTIPSNNPPAYNPTPGTVQTHVVAKGESLWGLSRKYGASVDSIRQANGLSNDLIRVGQTLQIPR